MPAVSSFETQVRSLVGKLVLVHTGAVATVTGALTLVGSDYLIVSFPENTRIVDVHIPFARIDYLHTLPPGTPV
ncbi:MAG: hypothetical protein HPY58_03900 [Firmicutes bacterium]|nr:hypothetical protein [Bacillota bacterium]